MVDGGALTVVLTVMGGASKRLDMTEELHETRRQKREVEGEGVDMLYARLTMIAAPGSHRDVICQDMESVCLIRAVRAI